MLRLPRRLSAGVQLIVAFAIRRGIEPGAALLLGAIGLSLPMLPVSRAAYLGFFYVLLIFGWLKWRNEDLRPLGLVRPDGLVRTAVIWLATVSACLAYSVILDPLLEPLLGADKAVPLFSEVKGNTGLYLMTLPMIWLFAAVGEELLYRGFLFNRARALFAGMPLGWTCALILQAGLFGLAHLYQGMSGVVGAVAYGLLFGLSVRAARGSLVPGMLAHGTIDTLGFTLLYLGKLS